MDFRLAFAAIAVYVAFMKRMPADLLQPFGSAVKADQVYQALGDEPRLLTRLVTLSATDADPESGQAAPASHGAGVGRDVGECLNPAIVEALERQAAAYVDERKVINASQLELGADALDLTAIHRCSEAEAAHPKCPLTLPRNDLKIRWIKGLRLHDGKETLLPLVLTHLCRFAFEGERFFFPISTGCAGHVSLEKALLSGLLEVIERDALSLIWLQRLALPQLNISKYHGVLDEVLDLYELSSSGLRIKLYDASLDHKIPVVYGVQCSDHDRRLSTLVSCSSAFSFEVAIRKVLIDMAACRISLRKPKPLPPDIGDFHEISHGALYMSSESHRDAFAFLGSDPDLVSVSPQLEQSALTTDTDRLAFLVRLLAKAGHPAYAIDLTTSEADYAGIRIIRAIIPTLQPLGFNYRARYLGTPRLYNFQSPSGQKLVAEDALNPDPQPFS